MTKLILTTWNFADTNVMPVQSRKKVRYGASPGGSRRQSILGNIYVGQVENIASNIQAAFVLIAPGVRGYFPLQEAEQVIYASGKAPGSPCVRGDQILVQVSRDAMKGKLPALTANLNFTGKYWCSPQEKKSSDYPVSSLVQNATLYPAGWKQRLHVRIRNMA